MPEVVLFGATGYTGRLTAHAIARRGLGLKLVGRNRVKLEQLARDAGAEIAVAEVGDVDALTHAAEGARVLVTCVGPFTELGDTAVQAALRAGCHYIDSTGEQNFVAHLFDTYGESARTNGLALAPALGFDEVPADVAITLACEGLRTPDAILTYAVPSTGSAGSVRTTLGILTSEGSWVTQGDRVPVRAGSETRWAPLPPPLGVRMATAFPFAITRLAPLHIDFAGLKTYVTTGRSRRMALRAVAPFLHLAMGSERGKRLADAAVSRLPAGPGTEGRRKRWTVLAEARSGQRWRNVVVTGRDVYGASAEFLAAGAEALLAEDFEGIGPLSPVQAVGLHRLQKEMIDLSVTIETYESG